MNANNYDILFRNNTSNKSKSSLVEGFVVRTKEFENIFQEIQSSDTDKPEQHYLIVGQRGSGKTTLVYRLKYAIDDDEHLAKFLIPIMFSEEQYHVSELANLWESIADYLADWLGWTDIPEKIESVYENTRLYEEKAFLILEDKLKNVEKQIVVFIENINFLFKKIGQPGQQRLREILTTSNYIRIIGTSTSLFDGVTDYSLPFYDFFKVIRLDGLSKRESIKLLLQIGAQYGAENEIRQIIKDHPGRVESLRRLTGGVPRTISYLFQIFLDNEDGKAIKDLYQLIDTLSLLYKSELDQLSVQQQKVVDIIARNWDAIGVKEIAKRSRYESKNVSSILAILEKNQVIEVVTTRGKNNLYRIRERFMNIWYLMRFGRKHDKENIIWLVRFFDAWCDETELARRISLHIDNLKGGKYDINAAIDMGNTFLSCEHVSEPLKYLLYTTTKSILPERLGKAVRLSNKVLYNKLQQLIEGNDFEQAINMLNEIEERDIKYYGLASWLYLITRNYEKSVEAAQKVLEFDPGNANATLTLGIVYEDYLRDIPMAEYYLKSALQKKHIYAASRLGDIAFYYKNDLNDAEKLHNRAIKRGFKPSILKLSEIYLYADRLQQAEKLGLEAIELKIPSAYRNLGKVYDKMNDSKKAIKMFQKAIDEGDNWALIELGIFYRDKRNHEFEKAKLYFEKAVNAGIIKGYSLLGKLYYKQLSNEEKAIEIYNEGVSHREAESAHQLAHIFVGKKDYDASDELFLKSISWGNESALMCLVDSIYLNGRNEKKEYALQIMESHRGFLTRAKPFGMLLYSKLLLWNNRIDDSIETFRNTYNDINILLKRFNDDRSDLVVRDFLDHIISYFLLLIAKSQFKISLSLFEDDSVIDFKMLIKPVYFVLMEYLKEEYPIEFLKAGKELEETMKEIKENIEYIKQMN